MSSIRRVNIQIKSFSEGWILSKFASMLHKNLVEEFGIEASINGDSNTYDVTHHIPYYDAYKTKSDINTFLITHVDKEEKETQIRRLLNELDFGICLSKSTSNMLRRRLGQNNLIEIIPGIDNLEARKVILGFASNVYADDRKKTNFLLVELLKLKPEEIKIIIIGSGWEEFSLQLKENKFEVLLIPKFDYEYYHRVFWNSIDYFVYPSHDEGSMAFLDACAYDVKTIVTYQGFHKDLSKGITHKIKKIEDLSKIVNKVIKRDLRQSFLVRDYTWKRYAKLHLELWEKLSS